ncbi:putative glutamate 5-kinase [Drechslerella stenobrocha 248]|uniref:Putative glutamate 5-kinase n=1 Tax=Drechslerella stenobrocha 248 TaxID=1043628 RepID=W7IDG6_9PEZI|nr:putative glutamate 5-kinase [Drechslerella stenobrocha 248]
MWPSEGPGVVRVRTSAVLVSSAVEIFAPVSLCHQPQKELSTLPAPAPPPAMKKATGNPAPTADVARSTKQLTIVIKLGTSSICDEKTHEPLISNLSLLVETVVRLRRDGHRVILVSSGAIGIGLRKLDLEKRPKLLAKCQAIAAIGQCELLALWDKLFAQLRQPVAQILLTRNDIADRTQYLNAANTFAELLHMGVVPIVNENDTLAVSEIKFGDNDTLSAITAGMVNADYLFLMTDVDCLYDKNPRTHPDAKPIMVVHDISSLHADVSETGSAVGTGGMSTKLVAAKLATSAGVTTVITRSSVPSNIFHIVKYCQSLKTASQSQTPLRSSSPGPGVALTQHLTPQSTDDPISTGLLAAATKLETTKWAPPLQPSGLSSTVTFVESSTPAGETAGPSGTGTPGAAATAAAQLKVPLHTRFLARSKDVRVRDRHFWLLHGLQPHGTLFIDQGAYNALTRSNRAGLLPVGIVDVKGEFHQLEAVRLAVVQREGDRGYTVVAGDVGRAIVNYSSVEIARIKGIKSNEIVGVLGYADTEYISHRDNTAFFPQHEKQKLDT